MMSAPKLNYRDEIAQEIIARIEAGTAPWQKPWQAGTIGAAPFNPVSGKPYRGINDMWLTLQGRADPRWLTYNQAVAAGGQVRKGEKSATIEYWQWTAREPLVDGAGKPVLDGDGKQQTHEVRLDRPRVFYAKVFNASQIDGLAPWIAPAPAFDPVERAEAILAGAGVPVLHDQHDRAFYRPASDAIHLPPTSAFHNAPAYYETALHELGHATGHPTRLSRAFGPFGSEGYAREELRAEISSYMLARDLGISFDPSNHAAYVESWLKVLREDKNEIFRAAKDAETIKTWVTEPEKRPELERAARQQIAAQARDGMATREQAVRSVAGDPPAIRSNSPNLTREPAMDPRTYITVPFAEKDAAKLAGAKWDRKEKSWYIPTGADPAAFTRWTAVQGVEPEIPSELRLYVQAIEKASTEVERSEALTDLIMAVGDLPLDRQVEVLPTVEKHGVSRASVDEYMNFSRRQAFEDAVTDRAIAAMETRQSGEINGPEKQPAAAVQEQAGYPQRLEYSGWRDLGAGYSLRSSTTHPKLDVRTPEGNILVRGFQETDGKPYQEYEFTSGNPLARGSMAWVDRSLAELSAIGAMATIDQTLADLAAVHLPKIQALSSATEISAPQAPAPEQLRARTYLAVPFADKEEAKKLGAKWSNKEKSWYITPEHDPAAFTKWSILAPSPTLTPEEEFAQALKAAGLELNGSPEMDGEWHRVRVVGDKGKETSGMYRGFLDGRPAGNITNYKAGQTTKWVSTGVALTEEERSRIQAQAAQVRADREAQRIDLAEKAAKTAYGIWSNLPAAATPENCPYLAGKGVGAHGVKVDGAGKLVIPARDADGKLWTVQFASADGKRWLKDSQKAGGMHVVEPTGKGTLDSLAPHAGAVVIAEGYATAARIFEATNRPVVVAFDSGNLLAVAEAIHAKFPDRPILLAADNDHANKLGNVGMIKAEEAAKNVGGFFMAPQFTAAEMAKGLTDFDDLGKARGNGAVRQAVEATLARVNAPERSIA